LALSEIASKGTRIYSYWIRSGPVLWKRTFEPHTALLDRNCAAYQLYKDVRGLDYDDDDDD